jgi:hypothetical protein
MASENFLARDDFGQNQRVKQFTTKSGLITYTAKTGRAADDFVIDRVIRVTTGSTYSLTITVPDGVYYGQTLLVLFEVEGGTETVDVTTTTGSDATQMTDDGGYWLGMWMGSTVGWVTIAGSAT